VAEGIDALAQAFTLIVEGLLLLLGDVCPIQGQKSASNDFEGRADSNFQVIVKRQYRKIRF